MKYEYEVEFALFKGIVNAVIFLCCLPFAVIGIYYGFKGLTWLSQYFDTIMGYMP